MKTRYIHFPQENCDEFIKNIGKNQPLASNNKYVLINLTLPKLTEHDKGNANFNNF